VRSAAERCGGLGGRRDAEGECGGGHQDTCVPESYGRLGLRSFRTGVLLSWW
jgi:hypothetical protein